MIEANVPAAPINPPYARPTCNWIELTRTFHSDNAGDQSLCSDPLRGSGRAKATCPRVTTAPLSPVRVERFACPENPGVMCLSPPWPPSLETLVPLVRSSRLRFGFASGPVQPRLLAGRNRHVRGMKPQIHLGPPCVRWSRPGCRC